MAALKEPVKIFIVQALACRDTPQEVAELVKQEFNIEIDRRQWALLHKDFKDRAFLSCLNLSDNLGMSSA